MSMNFQIDYKRENGDLYVSPVGDFDGSSAWELINLLDEQYDGHGQVHIDTGRLCRVCPFGCNTFQCQFYKSRVPAHKLLFKGKIGEAMAPKGSQVVGVPRTPHCQCTGICENCRCAVSPVHEPSVPLKKT